MAGNTYRSAITGHFVTPEFAMKHPDTTIAEDNLTSEHSDTLTQMADRIDRVREWAGARKNGLQSSVVVPTHDVLALLDIIDPDWRTVLE